MIDPSRLKTVSNEKILQVEDGSNSINKSEKSDESLSRQLSSESKELEQQLKNNATKNDYDRDQSWKDNFSKAFICAFWVLWLLFVVMCISLILHWITPEKYHWLSVDQLDKIKTIIIAALASKAITNKVEKSA